jgi:hypothetical protein
VSRSRLHVAALWSVSLWPAVNFLQANWAEVLRGGWLAVWSVVALAAGVALVAHLLYRLSKDRGVYLVVVWVAAVGMFFGYMTIRQFFISLFAWLHLWQIPPSFGWLGCCALLLLAAYRWRKSANLQNAATTFSLVAGGLAAVMLLVTVATTRVEIPDSFTSAAPSVSRTPARPVNVYYVILDAYGGRHALASSGFDNSAFLDRMRARGFRDVSTDRSNYLKTGQTLGSIFSLDYAFTPEAGNAMDARRMYPTQFDDPQPPALIAALQSEGYDVWFSDTVIVGCPLHHVSCLRKSMSVDSRYMLQAFLATTPVGRMLMRWMDDWRDSITPLVHNLDRLKASSRPMFVFAHHLSPHPPFTLNASCEHRLSWAAGFGVPTQNDREGYFESLRCVNRSVEVLIDHIIARDPGALIVIQGDHGPGLKIRWEAPMSTWTDEEIAERASYLNLVRAPDACAPAQAMGQVNTARFVLSCIEGRPPDYLPERTFLSTYFSGAERDLVREWHR